MVQRTLNGVPTGEQFVLTEIIGKGNFGEVYACQLPNGSRVAVKKMQKLKLMSIKAIAHLSSELRMLHDPNLTERHQNILYIDDALQSHSNLYIVMPLGGKVSSGRRGEGSWARVEGEGHSGVHTRSTLMSPSLPPSSMAAALYHLDHRHHLYPGCLQVHLRVRGRGTRNRGDLSAPGGDAHHLSARARARFRLCTPW